MSRLSIPKIISFVVVSVLLGSVTAVFMAEVLVRVLDLPPKPLEPLAIPKYRLSDNPILLFEYRKNYVAYEKNLPDFDRDWVTNSEGFRDKEFPYEKPAGVTRMLVLGDSITAGNGIRDPNDVYVKKLERILNDQAGAKRYEIINMGVGGYSTYQEAEFLRVRGLAYHPDVVLVGFCVNDFDSLADGGVYEMLRRANAHLDQSHHPTPFWQKLLKRSRLAFFVYHRWRALKPYQEVVEDYQEGVLNGGDPVTSGIRLLARLQEESGFKVLVFIIPAFDTPFSEYLYDDIHQRLRDAARPYPGIDVVDLLDDFRAVSDDQERFRHDQVHPNEYGNTVIAQILARILRERGII